MVTIAVTICHHALMICRYGMIMLTMSVLTTICNPHGQNDGYDAVMITMARCFSGLVELGWGRTASGGRGGMERGAAGNSEEPGTLDAAAAS